MNKSVIPLHAEWSIVDLITCIVASEKQYVFVSIFEDEACAANRELRRRCVPDAEEVWEDRLSVRAKIVARLSSLFTKLAIVIGGGGGPSP